MPNPSWLPKGREISNEAGISFDNTIQLVRMVTHIGGMASGPVVAMAEDRRSQLQHSLARPLLIGHI